MVVCLTSARFNMKADILRAGTVSSPVNPDDPDGEWIVRQDPDSGEIYREWQAHSDADDPATPEYEGLQSFKCIARGIISSGIGANGTSEKFGDLYEGVDYVRITFPADVRISRRDRITNIRDLRGTVLWVEEERLDNAPTVFSVVGVTPIVDPFGRHVESMALLERAETQ